MENFIVKQFTLKNCCVNSNLVENRIDKNWKVIKNKNEEKIMSHRINEIGSPTHLNASLSPSWWKFGCGGLESIDFDSIRWWTGNGVCCELMFGVVLGDDVTCDVDAVDDVGVTDVLWLTLSELNVAGVCDEPGDASDSVACVLFVFEFGVDLLDGFPVLEMSLAFECSSSRSLPPLSSFNASAASNDLRCIPDDSKKKQEEKLNNFN